MNDSDAGMQAESLTHAPAEWIAVAQFMSLLPARLEQGGFDAAIATAMTDTRKSPAAAAVKSEMSARPSTNPNVSPAADDLRRLRGQVLL